MASTAEPPSSESPSKASFILAALKQRTRSMSGWLKFLGVIYVLSGIPSLIVLVGAFNVWMGVLLYQAGAAAGEASEQAVLRMMGKLKTYFIVNAVIALIGIAMFVFFILFAGWAASFSSAELGEGLRV